MDINSIKERIAKLSRMTIDNGASENEAMFAAKKIAELLDEHGLTESEIKAYAAPDSTESMETSSYGNKKKLHEVQYCVNSIAAFFDVKVWISNNVNSRCMKFFGFPQDVAAAIALTETLVSAMENDFKAYMATNTEDVHGKTLRKSFMLGFASRVSQRLKEFKQERKNLLTGERGTAIVVLKNQVVETKYNELNMKLRTTYTKASYSNATAFSAGYSAGGRVSLGNTRQIAG